MRNRRDFLKYLGLAVGASLTGCGPSGVSEGASVGGVAPVPNAYKFLPLANSGQTLPSKKAILARASGDYLPLVGGVLINDLRHVCFHATDDSGRRGVYEVDYDRSGGTAPIKHIIGEGDVLADGTVVDEISGGYLNNDDDLAFVVSNEEGATSLQYAPKGGPLRRMFSQYDDLSAKCHLYGDLHSEVGLADNGDLLFVCNYRDDAEYAMGEGLFYLPKETASETTLLLGENQLLPGTNCAIKTFGLCEITAAGTYAVQGSAALAESDQQGLGADATTPTYLVRGRPGEDPEILVAHPSLGISSAIQGSVNMGPRLGASGCGYIVQTDSNKSQLYLNKSKLLEAAPDGSGSLSPRGAKIISMFPPTFGPNGLMLVQVFTTKGTELLAYNGRNFSSILSRGDVVNGNRVEMILFGALPHAINSYGEFATVVEYSSGESAILLGIPV